MNREEIASKVPHADTVNSNASAIRHTLRVNTPNRLLATSLASAVTVQKTFTPKDIISPKYCIFGCKGTAFLYLRHEPAFVLLSYMNIETSARYRGIVIAYVG